MTVNDIKEIIFGNPLAPEIKHFQAYRLFIVLGEGVNSRLIELKDPYQQIRENGKDIIMVVKDERIDYAMTQIEELGGNILREFSSYELLNNKDVVMAAVEQNGYALEVASQKLQGDKEVVMAAVKQNGNALTFASLTLQNDKEVVMAAVEQNGNALTFASQKLRGDKDVVMAAVKQNGNALTFALPKLQRDKELVMAAENEKSARS